MRFAQHLSSHLTPEWRKNYIRYDELKKMIYRMVGESAAKPAEKGNEEDADRKQVHVDAALEEQFFRDIQQQLNGIDSFYHAREAELAHHLRELEGEVDVLMAMLANKRTQNLRSSKRKRESLKLALSEYYLNLALLQNYQQLNHTGFRKILKKFDKLARSKRGGRFHKEVVCKSTFWVSKQIDDLILQTETIMIDKLEDGQRRKAMNRLRVPPLESRSQRSHWVTLRAGLFMGIILVSIIVVGVGVFYRPSDSWDNLTPILRGLRVGFIVTIWFYAFAINTYGWRRGGVNNVLIFEFDPRNFLNFVQLFEVASLLGVFLFIGLFLFVFSYWLGIPGWVGPLVMFGLLFLAFVLPLPLLYSRSRIWLGKELVRVILAPFFAVTFSDFWIADQFNSLAVVFLDIEFFLCFMFYGLHSPGSAIQCGSVTYGLRSVVAALPAWFRFAQCLRRYRDTRLWFPHLVNAGKYSTSFFVIFFSSLAAGLRDRSADQQSAGYHVAFILWIVSAIISSMYTFTWDIKMDWGLFEGKYKLRSELIYSKKFYYVLAIIEDLIFRSLWTLNISVGEAGASFLEGNILGSVLAIMEVFRRFVWNFFRLENEHLNNCGQFRVVRDISVHPLDLREVPLQDEEGAEPTLTAHFQLQRKMSLTLSDITSLRQRKGSEESVKSGRETSSGDSGFSNSTALNTIRESGEEDLDNMSDIITLHSTTV